ncbi:MAG: hypothetical protein ACOVMP_00240, partial [Chthoniobacterales bacterium]
MKSRTIVACITAILFAQSAVFAQMNLTFDMSALGNPSLNANNVYVTFAANSLLKVSAAAASFLAW